jgi:filamentous hemagglutinin family protein
MRRQGLYSFFSSLVLLSAFTENAFALPRSFQVVAGEASAQTKEAHCLEISTSDKAILEYAHFDIGKGQTVRFKQPSKHSTVLNRVVGHRDSEILGSIESNGKVFLVNPNGIYFGPNSTVNVGSFIASTLDIANQDFLEDRYRFILGKERSSAICNQGTLIASSEGAIALLAPFVQNYGTILAKAGKVLLASGEEIVLDFAGDGLISFAVEGKVKDALVENFGKIQALDGSVFVQLGVVKKSIQEVLNQEGIEEGVCFIEKGGRIFFASESEVLARQVHLEGRNLAVEGVMKGEEVHLLGQEIALKDALIDVSHDTFGGEVLIGGNFQGKGTFPYALQVTMDHTSRILANALKVGDGGLVVLWSQDKTLFEGIIEAKAGRLGGDGGRIETSSLGQLGILAGSINAEAPLGKRGTWLLDPSVLIVGSGTPSCSSPYCSDLSSTCYVSTSSIESAISDVTLSASLQIELTEAISMSTSSVGLTFSGCTSEAVIVSGFGDIVTNAGPVVFSGAAFLYEGSGACIIDTTNGGSAPTGANISFGEQIYASAAQDLNLNAGSSGSITLGSFDAVTFPLQNLTVINANAILADDIDILGRFTVTEAGSLSIGSLTAPGGVNATFSGNVAASSITVTGALESVTIQNTGNFEVPSITTNQGAIQITGPTSLISSTSYNSQGGNISMSGAVDGDQSLTLNAGSTGSINLGGAVGGSVALQSLSIVNAVNVSTVNITAGAISQQAGSGTSSFAGLLTSTGSTGIQLTGTSFSFESITTESNGGITISNTGNLSVATGSAWNLSGPLSQTGATSSVASLGGNISMTGEGSSASSISFQMPITLLGTQTWNSSNAGSGNGPITTGTINLNGSNLTLDAGTASSSLITLGNVSGSGTLTISEAYNLTTGSVTVTNLSATVSNTTIFGGALDVTSITSSLGGVNLSFAGNVTYGGSLPLSNTGTLYMASGITVALGGAFSETAATVNQVGATLSATSILFTAPVTLIGTSSWTATSGNVDASTVSGSYSLSIDAGSQTASFGQIGATELQSFSVTAGTIDQGSTVHVFENIVYDASSQINVGGNLTTDTGTIDWSSSGAAVLTAGPITLTATAGDILLSSSTITGAEALTLASVSGGSVSFVQAGTILSPLASFTITGATSLSGSGVVTNGGAIAFPTNSLLVLTGNTILDTTDNGAIAAGANITAGSFQASSSGAQSLTVNAGSSGEVSFAGSSSSYPLSSLTIAGSSISQTSAVSTVGAISYTADTLFIGGDQTASTGNITWSGSATLTGDVLLSSGGNIEIEDSVEGNYDFSLEASLGSVTLVFPIEVGTFSLNALEDSFAQDITTVGNLSIDVTGSGQSLVLLENTTFTSSAGSISTGDVNASAPGAESLILEASEGSVTMESIGASAVLEDLTVTALSIVQNGALNLEGTLTYTATAIDIENNITVSGSIVWTAPVVLSNTVSVTAGGSITAASSISGAGFGLALTAGGSISIGGSIGSSSAPLGAVSLSALSASFSNIYTNGSEIAIEAPATLNASAVISSLGGNIDFTSSVNGHYFLEINAGSSGLITIGVIGNVTPLTGLTVIGSQTFTPSFITTSGPITIYPAVELTSNVIWNTTSGSLGGTIHLLSTLDGDAPGNENMILRAGIGDILLDGAVGSQNSLGIFAIVSARNVATSDIFASSIIQEAGFGTSSFAGELSTVNFGGIRVQGNQFSFQGPVDVAGTGGVSITNAGTLTIGSNADMNIARSFLQQGAGSVQTAGNITTTGSLGAVVFNSAVALTQDVIWDTHLGSGPVLLKSTIDGPGALSIYSDLGTISFQGNAGSQTALGSLNVSAGSTLVNASLVNTSGGQTYNSPLKIAQSAVFSSRQGNIEVEGLFDSVGSAFDAVFAMGGGSLTFLDAIGSLQPLSSLVAYNTSLFSAEAITAGFLRVSGGRSEIYLNGDMTITGALGVFLDGGPIYLGGSIDAGRIFARSYGSILNAALPVAINISGPAELGLEVFDAIGGTIGSLESPIEINTDKTIALGADPSATMIGTPFHSLFDYVSGNVPCLVTFNDVVIRNCALIPTSSTLFSSLPKYWFYLPGIYSSWDNLSNWQYFKAGVEDLMENPRDRTLFWTKPRLKKNSLSSARVKGKT